MMIDEVSIYSFDMDFAHAIRQAATGKTDDLITLIKSDRPLGQGERNMLAEFIIGEFNRPKGRPAKSKVNPSDQRKAVAEYLQRIDNGEKSEAVANEIQKRPEVGIERSTFFSWVSEFQNAVDGLVSMGFSRDEALAKVK